MNKIKGIIQIGANDGQEISLFNSLSSNQIFFEPIQEAREKLEEKLSSDTLYNNRQNKRKFIFDQVVSNVDGEIDFFVGKEHGNSSLFDLNPRRPEFHLRNVHKESVKKQSVTLNKFFEENWLKNITDLDLSIKDFNYLYMDIQGAEHLAIHGACDVLSYIDYVYMEVSYAEIYSGTLLFDEMESLMDKYGFVVQKHTKSLCNHDQGDCLFVKKDLLNV